MYAFVCCFSLYWLINFEHWVNLALNVAAYITVLNLACYVMFISWFVFCYMYCPVWQMFGVDCPLQRSDCIVIKHIIIIIIIITRPHLSFSACYLPVINLSEAVRVNWCLVEWVIISDVCATDCICAQRSTDVELVRIDVNSTTSADIRPRIHLFVESHHNFLLTWRCCFMTQHAWCGLMA